MCGRFELKTKFDNLLKVLKLDYPSGLDTKYEAQKLIRPTDPVLVIKNEDKIKTTFMTWGSYPLGLKNHLRREYLDHLMHDQKLLRRKNYLVEVGNIKDA